MPYFLVYQPPLKGLLHHVPHYFQRNMELFLKPYQLNHQILDQLLIVFSILSQFQLINDGYIHGPNSYNLSWFHLINILN